MQMFIMKRTKEAYMLTHMRLKYTIQLNKLIFSISHSFKSVNTQKAPTQIDDGTFLQICTKVEVFKFFLHDIVMVLSFVVLLIGPCL